MRHGRAAAAPLALQLSWATLFSHRFFWRQAHQSLGSGEPDQPPQVHCTFGPCGFTSGFWERSRKDARARERLISNFGNWGFGASLVTSHSSWYGYLPGRIRADAPSRNNSVESWYVSLPKLLPPPTAVFASVHALSELNLLREPLSTAAHSA